jgi:hypothetical protein
MTESQFTKQLIAHLSARITDAKVGSKISVLYEMPIDDDGAVHMGVDADSGEPIRGGGTGFEQDILVYEAKATGGTSIIPRVIVEVKYKRVTTHDAIVYSYKADCIKRIYPFCRYGMVIGDAKNIPGRVLRHGRGFDFIVAMAYPLVPRQVDEICSIVGEELAASRCYGVVMRSKSKVRLLRRQLTVIGS